MSPTVGAPARGGADGGAGPLRRATFPRVSESDAITLPADLPLLALRSTIVLPGGRVAVQVSSADNIALLAAHPGEGALVACLLDVDPDV